MILSDPIFLKLEGKMRMAPEDKLALRKLIQNRIYSLPARRDLYIEGDPVSAVRLILDGWACRYDQLDGGRRQTLELLLPGDMLGLDRLFADWHHHSACSISSLTYALIPRCEIEAVCEQHPQLGGALMWSSSIDMAIQRLWIRSLGGMNAIQRIAHLFCELYYRCARVGLAYGTSYTMPMGQRDLAEALGLSTVQINRSVKVLRTAGLLRWQRPRVEILDLPRLADIGLFKPDYLELDGAAHVEPLGLGFNLTRLRSAVHDSWSAP